MISKLCRFINHFTWLVFIFQLNDEAFSSLDVEKDHYNEIENLTLDGNKLEKLPQKLLEMSLGMRFSAKNNRLTSVSIDYREPETAKCLTLWVQHGREAAHLLPRHLAVQLKSNSIFSVPYSPLHKLAHLSRLSYPLLFCIMHLKRHGC